MCRHDLYLNGHLEGLFLCVLIRSVSPVRAFYLFKHTHTLSLHCPTRTLSHSVSLSSCLCGCARVLAVFVAIQWVCVCHMGVCVCVCVCACTIYVCLSQIHGADHPNCAGKYNHTLTDIPAMRRMTNCNAATQHWAHMTAHMISTYIHTCSRGYTNY